MSSGQAPQTLDNITEDSFLLRMQERLAKAVFVMICLSIMVKNYLSLSLGFYSSLLLEIAFNAVVAAVVLLRRPAKRISLAPFDIMMTLIGTFSMVLITTDMFLPENTALKVVDIAGIVFCLWGVATLSRSFGLLPADRGVITGGPYKIIRHPIYAGYVVSMLSLLASTPTIQNFCGVAIYITAETIRIIREEKLLGFNPLYRAYMLDTPYRMLPYIW